MDDGFNGYDAGSTLLYGKQAGKLRIQDALFGGLNDVPVDGAMAPATVMVPPTVSPFSQVFNFLKSTTGLLLLAGVGFYLYKKGYLQEWKDKFLPE